MKRLICSLVTIAFSGSVMANDADTEAYMRRVTEVKQQLSGLLTSDTNELAKAKEAVRESITLNASKNDRDSQGYLRQIYAFGGTMIFRDPTMPLETKRAIVDILAEGGSAYWLAKVLGITGREVLSDEALDNIRKSFEEAELPNRDMILLAYRAKLPNATKRFEEISQMPIKGSGIPGIHKTVCTAWLVKAWDGDKPSLLRLLEYTREAVVTDRTTWIIGDLSTIHDLQCVEFLVQYLNSDEREPETRLAVPGTPVAAFAASALYKMLVGFPEPTKLKYNSDEDLERCREWIKQQEIFKFRKEPLTEEERQKTCRWIHQHDSLFWP